MLAQLKCRLSILVMFASVIGLPLPSSAQEVVTYGSLPDPGYDAIVWAIQNGKVSRPDVTLKVETITSIPAAIQAAMTAQYNLIGQGVLGIPQLRESGIPAKILSTLLRYHPEGHSADLWVLKDSPYKTIEDLKGKTIAVVSGESQNIVSIRWAIAERHKMNADIVGGDFRWVDMPSAQFEAAIQAGRVDAVGFSNVAAYSLTKSGNYRSVIHGSKELESMFGGPMPSLFVIGYEPDMKKRPDAYVAAGKLMKESAEYVLKNPEEVFTAVAGKYKMTKEDVMAWFTTFAQMPFSLGPTDKSVMEKSWQAGAKYGMLKSKAPSADEVVWPQAIYK